MTKIEKAPNIPLRYRVPEGQVEFDPSMVHQFVPFKHGKAIFGGHFGDEGKGKEVDITAREWREKGYKILSVRGQGSGNAGHTVKIGNKTYDFHYLTSAGFSADIMLLGAGMLLDPIKVMEESLKLPAEKRSIILIDERATVITALDRAMDAYRENQRNNSGVPVIGTTKSGVGPATGVRANRDHVTFADALNCSNPSKLRECFRKNPDFPEDMFREIMTDEYVRQLFECISNLNVVNGNTVIKNCRYDGSNEWALLLEVSQAVGLDHLFGNSGHFVTSSLCTDIGAAANTGLTMHDFPDGSTLVVKAYASKVGAGPFVTKHTEDEDYIFEYIYDTVGERGVSTGRLRDLGWFDGPAIRNAIQLTGVDHICMNCMDVMGHLPGGKAKICYAYKHKISGEVTYDWPYFQKDYIPLYVEVDADWDCFQLKDVSGLSKKAWNYINMVEEIIGAKITCIGTGGSSEDLLYLY